MSTLKELLIDVPVKWRTISEYIDYIQPTNYLVSSKNYHNDYKTPVLTAGKTFILGYTDEINGIFPASKAPVIIFDDFTTANKWVDFDFKAKSSAMKILVPKDDLKIVLKYFYYWLNSCPSELAEGDHKRQWISNFSLKLIPIPYPNDPEKSLAIQQEIVRVLDSLSEQNKALTSALAQEIENRKKQYAYFREELFRFEGKEVEWKTFGELGEIIRGNGLQKSDFTESGVGCIHYGQIYTYYGTSTEITKSFVSQELAEKLKKVNKGDLIITNTSENVEDVCKAVAWLGEDEIVTGGHACILKHYENAKYIAYYTQCSEFFKDKKKFAKGTKVMDVSAKDLAKIKIPVPSLQEQERIVRLLDQYDEATKNIIAQLEKEIELRNKQYNYYRDHLLTFPKE